MSNSFRDQGLLLLYRFVKCVLYYCVYLYFIFLHSFCHGMTLMLFVQVRMFLYIVCTNFESLLQLPLPVFILYC